MHLALTLTLTLTLPFWLRTNAVRPWPDAPG